MNKFVKEQLGKVRVAQLPEWDDDTLEMFIPKAADAAALENLQVGKYYLIKVEEYIVKPFDGFNLHENWNRGVIPKDRFMCAQIIQLMGKMVQINSMGYDYDEGAFTNNKWEGWLPRKSFKVIKEM